MAQSQINAGQIVQVANAIYKRVKEQIRQRVRASGRLSTPTGDMLRASGRDQGLGADVLNRKLGKTELRERALNELLRIIM
ncbi:MAG: hypothetical protein OWQ51_07935 [Pyrobaculum arsenaticum]|nr:hypothetical protein [Pyrobaculum arsenaticum]